MIKHFEGPYSQHGAGFGGFFKGLFKFLTPVIDKVKGSLNTPIGQRLAKDVIDTGIGLGGDILSGKNLKESATDNLRKAKKRVLKTVIDSVNLDGNSSNEEGEDTPPIPSFKKSRRGNQQTKKLIKKKFKRTIFD